MAQKEISASLRHAIGQTQELLLARQCSDGHWESELEGGSLLESETILLLAYLGEEKSLLARRCARYLLEKQLPDGGWELYPGGGADVANCVKAYFALKLTGTDATCEPLQRARQRIVQLGGADKVDCMTRFYLALLGQIPYRLAPVMPSQMILMPKWSPIGLDSMSLWSRMTFVPLSIVSALQPIRNVSAERGIRELFVTSPEKWKACEYAGARRSMTARVLHSTFQSMNVAMRFFRRLGITPKREKGLARSTRWILEHGIGNGHTDGFHPFIVWNWIALKAVGYADDSPEIAACRRQLKSLVVTDETNDTAHLQPYTTPVMDTALTVKALLLSGMTRRQQELGRALDWLLERQTSGNVSSEDETKGWAPGDGLAPDCGDTAAAIMAISGDFSDASPLDTDCTDLPDVCAAESDSRETDEWFAATKRGVQYLSGMQNRDGSWAVFDRDNKMAFMRYLPFAHQYTTADCGTPDATGRALESFGRLGYKRNQGYYFIEKAVSCIKRGQLSDGSWLGRWGVNCIYGTWRALTGLAAVGEPSDSETVVAGVNWLVIHQHGDGGWGESPASYRDPAARGEGVSTASQTAWAVMALIAAGKARHDCVRRGIEFLLARQRPDGSWTENEFTATGFPEIFYLKREYYPVYFPLMALSLYASAVCDKDNARNESNKPGLRRNDIAGSGRKTEAGIAIVSFQERLGIEPDYPDASAFSCWGIRPLDCDGAGDRPRLTMPLVMDRDDLERTRRRDMAGTQESGPVCFRFPGTESGGDATDVGTVEIPVRSGPVVALHLFHADEEDDSKLRIFT